MLPGSVERASRAISPGLPKAPSLDEEDSASPANTSEVPSLDFFVRRCVQTAEKASPLDVATYGLDSPTNC